MLFAKHIGCSSAIRSGERVRCAWIILVLAAAACSPQETAYMENPANGRVVVCGPYYIGGMGVQAEAERGCIGDYQRQGYVRVPGPNSK